MGKRIINLDPPGLTPPGGGFDCWLGMEEDTPQRVEHYVAKPTGRLSSTRKRLPRRA